MITESEAERFQKVLREKAVIISAKLDENNDALIALEAPYE